MDFTLKKYSQLLDALQGHKDGVMLRHDVDLKPERSLAVAKIEAAKGWKAVYYFRAVPESWDEGIIRQIKALGHEIGYHYESLTTCRGDVDAAWEDFKANLARLREVVGSGGAATGIASNGTVPNCTAPVRSIASNGTAPDCTAPVRSICMHGSPRSPWDSRDIWNTYNYRDLGVDFEPYLDTDWSRTFYLTDTGRRWDGWKVSVRDKIPHWQDVWASEGLIFHSTNDIIRAASLPATPGAPESPGASLPERIMITTHPQRWMNFGAPWLKELILQNAKNLVKRLINLRRKTQ